MKLEKFRRAQSQFLLIVVIAGLSVALISAIFIIFNEIKDKNELFSQDNQLNILGEKITSSIVKVYTTGESMSYNGTESKLLYSMDIIIPEEYVKYVVKATSDKIVITHQNEKKEINMHNLINIEVEGTAVGRNIITIAYYRNQTDKRIQIS
ncbi:MAG: hypothetical protein JSW73_03490 [Candidatus Woesearchaeota archaeon]|nr:MAG: hypothetical protein JSW73_03490 [Candidatus Woesearchaeota archaeon]